MRAQTRLVLFANFVALIIVAVLAGSYWTQKSMQCSHAELPNYILGETRRREEQGFAFAVSHYNSSRQYGKCKRCTAYVYYDVSGLPVCFLCRPKCNYKISVHTNLLKRPVTHHAFLRLQKAEVVNLSCYYPWAP